MNDLNDYYSDHVPLPLPPTWEAEAQSRKHQVREFVQKLECLDDREQNQLLADVLRRMTPGSNALDASVLVLKTLLRLSHEYGEIFLEGDDINLTGMEAAITQLPKWRDKWAALKK